MPIQVSCAECGRRHQAPDQLAGQQAKCACGALLSIPRRSAGLQFYEDAQRELKAREAEEAANLPTAVRMVLGGTLSAGVMSLLATLFILFVLSTPRKIDRPADFVFVALLFVLSGVLAALNFSEAGMIYAKIPAARPFGYCVAVANFCGGPVHWACAVLCFIGLSSADIAKYLDRR